MSMLLWGVLVGGVATGQAAPPPVTIVTRPVKSIARTAKSLSGALINLFTEDDYPPQAIRNEEQGTVTVRFVVGVTGRVESCTVLESSGSATLDAATCTILARRARFLPALNGKGAPVTDTFQQRVRWVLPVEPHPTVDSVDRGTILIDATGKAIGCDVADLDTASVDEFADKCRGMQELVDEFARRMPGIRKGTYRSLTVAMSEFFPASGEPQWQVIGPDADLISDIRNRFEIGADGKVIRCQFLASSGVIPLPQKCSPPGGDQFDPAPQTTPPTIRIGFGQLIVTANRN